MEELYIKWNEKIDVSANKIVIHPKKKENTQNFSPDTITSSLKKFALLTHIFNSVIIKELKYNDITASIFYKENTKHGYINVASKSFQFKSSLYASNKYIQLHINNLHSLKRDISLAGDVYVDNNDFQIYAKTALKVQEDINVNLYVASQKSKIFYLINNTQKINSIKYLVDSFHLPKPTLYWILDAIKMDYLSIEKAQGFIDLKHTEDILKNIEVDATVHGLDYMYNKDLDAIHTQETKLQFKQGVLYIHPQEAYSYGMFLDKSWLKIDFTPPEEELLTLHLLFNDGMLNKDVLNILNTYHIKLPFLQHKGKVQTKLKLTVGLRTLHVDAQGSFATQDANFDYLGLNIDVKKALIKLDNYDVSIKNMLASYKDIAKANVDVTYNAKQAQGTIGFNLSKVNVAKKKMELFGVPLHVLYNISPKGDTVNIAKSMWKVDNKILTIDPIKMPFNLETLQMSVPTTFFNIPDMTKGYISGSIDLNKELASFDLDVLSLKYKNTILNGSNTQLQIHYDKKLTLSCSHDILLDAGGLDIKLSKFLLDMTPDSIQAHKIKVNINNTLFTQLNSNYNLHTNSNTLLLDYLNIVDGNTSVYNQNAINLKVESSPHSTSVISKELNTQFIMKKDSWKFKTKSLGKLAKNSSLLQKLQISKGKLVINKKANNETIYIKTNLKYKYPFLLTNNKKVKNYTINATVLNNIIDADINEKIKLHIDDSIRIALDNCSIDMQELLKIKKNVQLPTTKSEPKTILLKAKNVALQLTQTRKIISDTISMQSDNNITTLQLKHNKAIANLKIENDTFHLYGSKFNDKFMENLFSLSKFKDGELEFSVKGTSEDFNGAFYIHDTTVVDYKLLNNILAFINTVPSLVTFSLPDYNKNGLRVQTAYAKFHSINGLFNISDFSVNSKEINILGKGNADIYKDTIDLTLNLKTDLGSDASKIPIVGYILFDKDVISTSMKITGKLSDPEVHSLLARDIVVAPLNILKRTILLPFKFISDVLPSEEEKKK